eukprot:TRINITY_DN26359_c0_g1_i1.p2 TRINITY_DN26359_c0_g1~~TRINITY_DN26359_c0_g1_i1.p2  ORF type:complete len:118 (-),score=21.69 TRINITY_DN26359_c0_g1_i1:39-392(-)
MRHNMKTDNPITHARCTAVGSSNASVLSQFIKSSIAYKHEDVCVSPHTQYPVDEEMVQDPLAQLVCPGSLHWMFTCLLYTSDAADEEDSVDLGGRRIIKKKKRERILNRRMRGQDSE